MKHKQFYSLKQARQFVFKNEKRKKAFGTIDKALNLVYKLALWAFVLSVIAFVVAILVLTLGAIITLGLIFLVPEGERFTLAKSLMSTSVSVLPYTLIIFFVAFLTKFTFEFMFLSREISELRLNREKNKHQLAIAAAVKKVRILGLLYLVLFSCVIAVLLSITDMRGDTWGAVLVIVAVVSFVVYRIASNKAIAKVQPDIYAIIGG